MATTKSSAGEQMNTGKQRHQPKRKFTQVERPELNVWPYCGAGLQSTGSLHLNKEVQTLVGVQQFPLWVRFPEYASGQKDIIV